MAGSPKVKPEEQAIEELNLVEWPLGLLCDKRPPGENTIVCTDTVRDAESGRYVNRKVIITGGDEWGLPTWQDVDIFLALMKLTNDRNGFAERKIRFSLYELRQLLAWPSDGRYKRRLKEGLLRLFGLSIAYDHAWRSNGKWKSLSAFHLLDNIALTNTPENFDPDEEQYVKWNDTIVDSVRASHTKGIDWGFYLSLKFPTTKRLYRFLDKRFGLGPEWTFDLEDFCKEKLGMSRTSPVWECRRQLIKGIEELEARGFIAGEENRFERVGKGSFVVRLRDVSKRKGRTAQPAGQAPAGGLAQELWKRGVTNASELAAKFPEAEIQTQLENFDHRVSKGEKLSGGWLRKAIETPGGYAFRKGYKSQAERKAEAEAAAERQRAKKSEELAREKANEAKRQAHAERTTELRTYFDSLPPIQRDALERAALDAATPFLRSQYKRAMSDGSSMADLYWESMVFPVIEAHMEDERAEQRRGE